jgi:hypothetical protein
MRTLKTIVIPALVLLAVACEHGTPELAGPELRLSDGPGSFSAGASARQGDFHAAKECSAYNGAPGDYCTITYSNVKAIQPGSRVYYLKGLRFDDPSGKITIDTDVRLVAPGNVAFGHCIISDFAHAIGVCTFSGGTGRFRDFHARATVSADRDDAFVAHWDGVYSFDKDGDGQN